MARDYSSRIKTLLPFSQHFIPSKTYPQNFVFRSGSSSCLTKSPKPSSLQPGTQTERSTLRKCSLRMLLILYPIAHSPSSRRSSMSIARHAEKLRESTTSRTISKNSKFYFLNPSSAKTRIWVLFMMTMCCIIFYNGIDLVKITRKS